MTDNYATGGYVSGPKPGYPPLVPDGCTFLRPETGAMKRQRTETPRCVHGRRTPVEALDGETVAQLCLNCDTQLSADFVPSLTDLFHDPNLTADTRRKRRP